MVLNLIFDEQSERVVGILRHGSISTLREIERAREREREISIIISGNLAMNGYLFKRSDHLKRWNKRFFKLEGSNLSYYDDAHSRKERGSWRIDPTCSISKYHERENAFVLSTGGKPVILAADDDFALDKWCRALAVPMGKASKDSSGGSTKTSGGSSARRYKRSYATKAGPSYLFGQQASYKETGEGLRDAIKHGDFDSCQKILRTKKDLAKFVDGSDNSVLHLAVLFNDKKIAQLLVECGADINMPNKRKETPLTLAKTTMKKYLQQWSDAVKTKDE